MFDRIETPRDLHLHKLGATLKMEKTALEMLGEFEEAAQSDGLIEQLRRHAEETKGQIRNLERVFRALGAEPDEKPCPAIEGLQKEGKQNLKQTDERLVDAVILAGAAETEHHEIAVYENLITDAKAMGKKEVVELLQKNLEQEQHTLEEVKGEAEKVAAATA